MVYVISNIHGNYTKFTEMLEKISFSDNDIMYVLGDIVDYGDESMELICDLSVRMNVYPVMGEHDAMAYKMLSGFDEMVKKGGTPSTDFITEMQSWSKDGGDKTLASFRALDEEMKEGVLDYLVDMMPYDIAEAGGKKYLLVHAGILNFEKGKDLDDYDAEDFYSEPLDMDKEYFGKTNIVVGHTPTENGKITRKGKNIAIDCGEGREGALACLCLDNGKEYYI